MAKPMARVFPGARLRRDAEVPSLERGIEDGRLHGGQSGVALLGQSGGELGTESGRKIGVLHLDRAL